MGVNNDKPQRWEKDIETSVDMYNRWFMTFAPQAFQDTRGNTVGEVEKALRATTNLTKLDHTVLIENPAVLSTLRMSTCPPLAVDRLIGLAGVRPNLVKSIEKKHRLPPRMPQEQLVEELKAIVQIIKQMLDTDIFGWLNQPTAPTDQEVQRAASIVADRLCGSVANPIVRNAQEARQIEAIEDWLNTKGYAPFRGGSTPLPNDLPRGTYALRMNVSGLKSNG